MSDIQVTYDWFKKAIPEPTSKNFHTQLGVHLEEVGEMLEELNALTSTTQEMLTNTLNALQKFADHLKGNDLNIEVRAGRETEFLDALCDQIVTATGVGYMESYLVPQALAEINASNWSKFDNENNPIFDENKKIIKSTNYFKPRLDKFI